MDPGFEHSSVVYTLLLTQLWCLEILRPKTEEDSTHLKSQKTGGGGENRRSLDLSQDLPNRRFVIRVCILKNILRPANLEYVAHTQSPPPS